MKRAVPDMTGAGTRPRIRLIGLPTDSHSSFLRGAAPAPEAIRRAFGSDHSNRTSERGIEIGVDVLLEDAGDLPLTEGEGDVDLISDAVEAIARDGCVPLCLGGDHMVTYPIVRGLARIYGPLNIIHFDAHPDLYDEFLGDHLSHASPFARIMEAGLGDRLVQIGIRTLNEHCRAQAERFGVELVEMRRFRPDRLSLPGAPLYVSIDLDALDPAFAPGVSHPEPGGLSTRELIAVLHEIAGPIVGGDIVELNPSRDPGGITATVAAKLLKEIGGLAAA